MATTSCTDYYSTETTINTHLYLELKQIGPKNVHCYQEAKTAPFNVTWKGSELPEALEVGFQRLEESWRIPDTVQNFILEDA